MTYQQPIREDPAATGKLACRDCDKPATVFCDVCQRRLCDACNRGICRSSGSHRGQRREAVSP